MNRRSLLLMLSALAAGGAVGYFAGAGERGAEGSGSDSTIRGAAAKSAESTAQIVTAALSLHPGSLGSVQPPADPVGALQAVRDEKNPIRQRDALDSLCASLDARGLQAILRALPPRAIEATFEQQLVMQVTRRWAEIEPRQAAEFVAGMHRSRNGPAIYAVMGAWAEADAASAWKWAVEARNREIRQYAVNAVLGEMAENDPEAAFRALEELPPAEDKSFYVSGLFRAISQKDIGHASSLALEFPTANLRQVAMAEVTQVWAQKDPASALAWFLENKTQAGSWQWDQMTVENVLRNWVRSAPEQAAAFAAALPPGSSRNSFISALGGRWGAADPKAAAGWLQSLPKSAENARAFDSLIREWGQNKPAAAGEFLLTLPADRTRDDLLDTLGGTWAHEDPAAALAWARARSEPEMEHLVVAQAIGVMMARDLANPEKHLGELKTPKAQSEAIREVSNNLTSRGDPEGALNWIMQLDARHLADDALKWPMEDWTRRSSAAAGEWLARQPEGSRRNTLVDRYANGIAEKDASAAAAWASTISDDAMRQKRLKAIVYSWARKDAAAAGKWLSAQNIGAAQMDELVQEFNRAGGK